MFLDDPLPPDLPASPARAACNNGFSAEEAYVACLIECAVTGSADPGDADRPKVAGLPRGNPGLLAERAAARRKTLFGPIWEPDEARVRRIVEKLARGHIAFEINEPQTGAPASVQIRPLMSMTKTQREATWD